MRKNILAITACLLLTGCVDEAIRKHNLVASNVQLGDSKEKVLTLLMPTQDSLSPREKKSAEQYLKGGVKVAIYYFRTGRQPDGLTTDDEFTPYVFHDGKLVAIGWATLGGPKTQGQVKPQINMQQNTTVY